MNSILRDASLFSAPYAPDDAYCHALFSEVRLLDPESEARIDGLATRLIESIRSDAGRIGGIDDLLHAYSLSSTEGVALMVLAEALLRVPDSKTVDRLIEDKLAEGRWLDAELQSETLVAGASSWALGIASQLIDTDAGAHRQIAKLIKRVGAPAVRAAVRQIMRLMGDHFVLGETIEAALKRSRSKSERVFRHSFDMLGEGARTAEDARRYLASYFQSIQAIGLNASAGHLPEGPGISIKLSALHPQYGALHRERVLEELVPNVVELAQHAKNYGLNLTVDAEEADRLELSLDVFAAVVADESLAGWDGLGLAIQAYQRRALAVVDYADELALRHRRRLMVRLVKGAYWDTEIKRAQERGLENYPVFTTKEVTDISYLACAKKLLACRPRIFPQFATHNALSVATIVELAGGTTGYEFQRLHGMGEAMYRELLASESGSACRVYAPVGRHRDLLAYLVRRLLENGANSSFVAAAANSSVSIPRLLARPYLAAQTALQYRNTRLPLPKDLYAPDRLNSSGVEFGDRSATAELLRSTTSGMDHLVVHSIVDGELVAGEEREKRSPIDVRTAFARVLEPDVRIIERAVDTALHGFFSWSATAVSFRADCLDRVATALEHERGRFIRLLQIEAGKTLDDCVSEIREAVDFCRYYAALARVQLAARHEMPGPTGEKNALTYRPRGVFICISPWNFPLAIFIGQVAAALVAGNTVVAKPAEQTPAVAFEASKLLLSSGVPPSAFQLVLGAGDIGAGLVAHPAIAGVVFTGSTDTAWAINRTLASKKAPIVPLIAETGGINAMIVDATALPEQVSDDVIASAFRSAGQRCSALRLLCIQDDVATQFIEMVKGAALELKVGDPRDPAVAIGPVIDSEAQERLLGSVRSLQGQSRVHLRSDVHEHLPGYYVGPHIFEIEKAPDLRQEVFGPVLHVLRWRAEQLDALLDGLSTNGFGLTLGIHSRINSRVEHIVRRMPTGNIYVNRNMIGAVVGTQPFGGVGLSGTGPKAGGPNYLKRFVTEQVVSINTTAAGGNTELVAGDAN